ncbi:MAG: hypothetical protein FWF80_00280 [Defluviitaleaceae bacterium]|nr:hypothetical protein [Defluviitaleaceae bacterium]
MTIERQKLHDMLEIVEENELLPLYYLLCKFIPADVATVEEIEAIQRGREQIARGEFVPFDELP